ncbi:MAG: AraC family transcriptional regulator [Panacagrimonas sp.]|jgi:AraC-like DNA-binding protein|nr:AraC family transcriptional regulator [Panacagrimonas sp.]MCC2657539.1 AraC family transcriptional regulator [Panacagrimonas sp.]
MSELHVTHLLHTDTLDVRHVRCAGTCRHRSAEECASATQLVFPYRGAYLRHVGSRQFVADANHVQFFNAGEAYRVSHPVDGGDRSLVVALSEPLLHELAPRSIQTRSGGALRFDRQHLRIDPRAQALVALIRHGLENGTLEHLEAETLLLTLVSRSLGPRTSHHPDASPARSRLVDRVKLLLAGDLSRRWTLAEIADQIGGSPVYLTQVFQQVEGVPLYRYHLRLRLARALDLVPGRDDLAALGLDLGFSSHSHFTTAFRQAYGRSPSEFKRTTRH